MLTDTNETLNRLSVIHNRSLPMYLRYAVPWLTPQDSEAAETIESIAEDQQEYVDRFGEMIVENGGQVSSGEFPMAYTGYHDLTIDFLLHVLIKEQTRNIIEITAGVEDLRMNPMARAVAEESLGAAKAHLDALQDLKKPAAA